MRLMAGRATLDLLDVEKRFIRACKTCRALPDREHKFLHSVPCSWPEVVREEYEAYGYTEAELPRFRPTPFDVSDMLTALAWARGLEPKDFKIVWWRSFDNISFGMIARRIGRSDETARRRYKDVMLKLWHHANLGDGLTCVANVAIIAANQQR